MTSKDGLTRRTAMVTMAAVGGAGLLAKHTQNNGQNTGGSAFTPKRQPVMYVPHGGGPWPFVDLKGFVSKKDVETMRTYLLKLPQLLPEAPKALLVISAHWEQRVPTVMSSPNPPMYYDYGGFPPESYEIQWPAPGDPALAHQVQDLLEASGIATAEDTKRGFDHGTFIPFKVSWPNAEVPTVQLSLKTGLDPEEHLAIGRALAPLREQGVLILGSGMSYHNMRGFGGAGGADSLEFDAWLRKVAAERPGHRDQLLTAWSSAPKARQCHPREEHLLPLMVVAGAAGDDVGRVAFNEEWMGVKISAIHFG